MAVIVGLIERENKQEKIARERAPRASFFSLCVGIPNTKHLIPET